MSVKNELQTIISGNGPVRHGEIIQTITGYLRREKEAISAIEKAEFSKEQEEQILISFLEQHDFWYHAIDASNYIGEGAEQKVYEASDPAFVIKINDSIFYEYWEDYLNNILIHNYFFQHLAYQIIGFHRFDNRLHAVVKQPFIMSTEATDLENVKDFLAVNGFINKKNNDYFHPGLGIILEDLHDENVLTAEGALQFIDTAFFLMPSFFENE